MTEENQFEYEGNQQKVLAAAGMSRLAEPSDVIAKALVELYGREEAYRFIANTTHSIDGSMLQSMSELLEAWGEGKERKNLAEATLRWRSRVNHDAVKNSVRHIQRLGGGVLTPEDDGWPPQLLDLEYKAPFCLWWRGSFHPTLWPARNQMVNIVGSRDATNYGTSTAVELASQLAEAGITVVSGGAYGIDAMAHRGALSFEDRDVATFPTIAVMAGGLDRYYPAGNAELLEEVRERGVLISETPPGTAPTRWRFLQRNRLIAALTDATVVVEARWRSGALSTAHHALDMGRAVGAVPGPVNSASSQGCLKMIKDGAELIRDAQDVLLMLGKDDHYSPHSTDLPFMKSDQRVHDQLSVTDLMLLDALPVRGWTDVDHIAGVAGLSVGAILGGLSRLQMQGLARTRDGLWQKEYAKPVPAEQKS